MTTVAVLPYQQSPTKKVRFEAVVNDQHATGSTVGKAIDALRIKLGPASSGSLVVVQEMQGDEFFSESQIVKMQRLMSEWRRCRDSLSPLSWEASGSLEQIVDDELAATIKRCQAAVPQ